VGTHRGILPAPGSQPGYRKSVMADPASGWDDGSVQGSTGTAPDLAARGRVLVADDHAALRAVIADALRTHGYAVDEAADGHAALELLRAGGYCAAVLDQKMPGSDGLAVAESIREQGLGCTAIVISVVADPETRRRATEVGARFHEKPFQLDDLLADVEAACIGSEALR